MGSINATIFARKISDTLRQGKIVNRRKLAKESGYKDSVASSPTLITNTKSFKVAFALEQKDIVEKIDRDIARVQEALGSKNLKKEEAKTLTTMLDTFIKNKQLLSGGSTANIGISIAISEHVAGKYAQQQDSVSKEGST